MRADQIKPNFQQPKEPSKTSRRASDHAISLTLQALRDIGLLNLQRAEAYQTWEAGISDLTDDQLREGRIKARDYEGWLTLGAFRSMCINQIIPACHRPYLPPPEPKMNEEYAQQAIAKLRKMFP